MHSRLKSEDVSESFVVAPFPARFQSSVIPFVVCFSQKPVTFALANLPYIDSVQLVMQAGPLQYVRRLILEQLIAHFFFVFNLSVKLVKAKINW